MSNKNLKFLTPKSGHFFEGKLLPRIWESIKYYSIGLYNYVDDDHCFLLSAGIAFNVLYCVLPLSLVMFYFLSATLTSDKAITLVLDYVTKSFPLPVYQDILKDWIAKKLVGLHHESNLAGIIGGISLFWLASILFSTLRTSLNAVLNMAPKSNMLFQKVRDFVLMLLVLFLLLSSTFLEPVVGLLEKFGPRFLPEWLDALLDSTIPYLISIALSIVLYVILFRMLPHERLSRRVIFVSATTTVVLTEGMRRLFLYYMTHMSSVGTLYGTYAFLVGISLWVYYASLTFLIGAEVGWLYKERNEVVAAVVPTLETVEILKNPGQHAIAEPVIEQYEQLKHNPTRAAGEVKPSPEDDGTNPNKAVS